VASEKSQPTARELGQKTEIARLRCELAEAAARIIEQSSQLCQSSYRAAI